MGETDNEWAGIAIFSSTSYNLRDYFPFTEVMWEGAPLYPFQVTVFCK